MSFVIDESKLEKLLKSSESQYTVAIAPGGLASENITRSPYESMAVSGTVAYDPYIPADARERLMTIREKIVKSGTRLKSADALDREIASMRRR